MKRWELISKNLAKEKIGFIPYFFQKSTAESAENARRVYNWFQDEVDESGNLIRTYTETTRREKPCG